MSATESFIRNRKTSIRVWNQREAVASGLPAGSHAVLRSKAHSAIVAICNP
jgi:hypothetical protein